MQSDDQAVDPTDQLTPIDVLFSAVCDRRLSWAARGVYASIAVALTATNRELNLTVDWLEKYTSDADRPQPGLVVGALQELVDAGYLRAVTQYEPDPRGGEAGGGGV